MKYGADAQSQQHIVRSWAHIYDAIESGRKTHDLRRNDRNYQVGDTMLLKRFDNVLGRYTGEEMRVLITYITGRDHVPCAVSSAVLNNDYCILSIVKVAK